MADILLKPDMSFVFYQWYWDFTGSIFFMKKPGGEDTGNRGWGRGDSKPGRAKFFGPGLLIHCIWKFIN